MPLASISSRTATSAVVPSSVTGGSHHPMQTCVRFQGWSASADLAYTLRGLTRVGVQSLRDVQYPFDPSQEYYVIGGAVGSISQALGQTWGVSVRAGRHHLTYHKRPDSRFEPARRYRHGQDLWRLDLLEIEPGCADRRERGLSESASTGVPRARIQGPESGCLSLVRFTRTVMSGSSNAFRWRHCGVLLFIAAVLGGGRLGCSIGIRHRAAGRARHHDLGPVRSVREIQRRDGWHLHLSVDRTPEGRWPDAAAGRS